MADIKTIRLATRGSALALWQTRRVADLLTAQDPHVQVEPVIISTKPDRIQDRPLHELGGDKGLFVKEVEQAVLDGRADAAVHSLKDVPVDDVPARLELVAFPERADYADVLLTRDGGQLADLAAGCTVATGAPRRQAQLLALRPDLKVCGVRGNVETRVRKLMDGEFDGIIMAAAGLKRLGMEDRISQVFSRDEFVPAPGQGIIAVQAPSESPFTNLLRSIDSQEARLQAKAERLFSRAIGADCYTAAGCLLQFEGEKVRFTAVLCSPDGGVRIGASEEGPANAALAMVQQIAAEIQSRFPN